VAATGDLSAYGGSVTTVDRRRWIDERLRFLRDLLDGDTLSTDERAAVEAEIGALAKEGGHTPRWLRHLLGVPRNASDR